MALDAKSPNGAVRSEINVTPLVDVCLVLLIIFMVVTPMMIAQVKVDLPRTSQAPSMPGQPTQLAVSIRDDGSVYVGGSPVAEALLRETLAAMQAAEPDREVIVRGDRRLGYEKFCNVLAVLSEVGFKRVGLVTEKEAPSLGSPGG
jgi:biopolymer transport protein TolR